MKLRIRGNSIRLRLSKSEIVQLAAGGQVTDEVQFSASAQDRLTYSVSTSANQDDVTANFTDRGISVIMPAQYAFDLANTEQVGLEHLQPIDDKAFLRITVEKDFQCLQPRIDEDESDNFSHPEPESACGLG